MPMSANRKRPGGGAAAKPRSCATTWGFGARAITFNAQPCHSHVAIGSARATPAYAARPRARYPGSTGGWWQAAASTQLVSPACASGTAPARSWYTPPSSVTPPQRASATHAACAAVRVTEWAQGGAPGQPSRYALATGGPKEQLGGAGAPTPAPQLLAP